MNLDMREMRNRLQAFDRSGRWYEIRNAAGGNNQPAEVRIWGTIGGWFGDVDAQAFTDELDTITADEITVSINSVGGDVFDGIGIYNALRQHDAHVTTRVDSMAASIASVIAQAGDDRVMVTASQMMIHNAWGMAIGDAAEMREMADMLERQDGVIASIYAARSDRDVDEYAELMKAETWFTAAEAVEAGLADSILDPPRKEKPGDADVENRTNRFADQVAAVVTAVEQVTTETENVITFRTNQGKSPLSDDAVASLSKLAKASHTLADRLNAEPAAEPADTDPALAARLDDEYAKFLDLSLRIDQLGVTT